MGNYHTVAWAFHSLYPESASDRGVLIWLGSQDKGRLVEISQADPRRWKGPQAGQGG